MLDMKILSPHGGELELGWATLEETSKILALIRAFRRQSMNLRVMNDARLYVCRDGQELAGWIGISTAHFDEYAEYFSLFVKPEYRGLGLGLALELAVVEEAHRYDHRFLHFRVDSKVEDRLTRSRSRSGAMSVFEPLPEIERLCTSCELFGSLCQSQTFMKVEVGTRRDQLRAALKQRRLPLLT